MSKSVTPDTFGTWYRVRLAYLPKFKAYREADETTQRDTALGFLAVANEASATKAAKLVDYMRVVRQTFDDAIDDGASWSEAYEAAEQIADGIQLSAQPPVNWGQISWDAAIKGSKALADSVTKELGGEALPGGARILADTISRITPDATVAERIGLARYAYARGFGIDADSAIELANQFGGKMAAKDFLRLSQDDRRKLAEALRESQQKQKIRKALAAGAVVAVAIGAYHLVRR